MEPDYSKRRKIACIASMVALIVLVVYTRCSDREPDSQVYKKATTEVVRTGTVDANLSKKGLGS